MYFKKICFILISIVISWDICTGESLRTRHTTKPSWTESSTFDTVLVEDDEDGRYHHKPQKPPQYPPLNQLQYPSQNLPHNPPQYQPPSSSNNPPQYPQLTQPQLPPSLPHNPPQYPHLTQPQLPPSPPHSPPQYPQLTQPQLPPSSPHNPPHYPPLIQPQLPPYNPPINQPPTTILDQFDYRYPDGSYEFRYQLVDETVRYERGYFVRYQNTNILNVKGYYSYRLPDLRYLTVFYTADQYGYRQDLSTFSSHRPQLPRSLNVDTTVTKDVTRSEEIENSTTTSEGEFQ